MKETKIICPRCGGMTWNVYLRKSDGGFACCDNCVDLFRIPVTFYNKLSQEYMPRKVRCPKCGELCRTIYRKSRYADIVGCDKCLYAVDAVQDADALPADYGLEEEED